MKKKILFSIILFLLGVACNADSHPAQNPKTERRQTKVRLIQWNRTENHNSAAELTKRPASYLCCKTPPNGYKEGIRSGSDMTAAGSTRRSSGAELRHPDRHKRRIRHRYDTFNRVDSGILMLETSVFTGGFDGFRWSSETIPMSRFISSSPETAAGA